MGAQDDSGRWHLPQVFLNGHLVNILEHHSKGPTSEGFRIVRASQVFLNGHLVGTMEHGKSAVLQIVACSPADSTVRRPGHHNPRPCRQRGSTELLVLVHAMGRNSAGCDWDFKGLVGSRVMLEGAAEP